MYKLPFSEKIKKGGEKQVRKLAILSGVIAILTGIAAIIVAFLLLENPIAIEVCKYALLPFLMLYNEFGRPNPQLFVMVLAILILAIIVILFAIRLIINGVRSKNASH